MTQTSLHRVFSSRWRTILIILAVLIVVEMITVAAVILPQQFRTNNALQQHARQQLASVVAETRENAHGFMTQAQNGVMLTQDLFVSGQLSFERSEDLERYFLAQLKIVSHVDGFFFGNPNGDFIFTKRTFDPPNSRFVTKIVRAEPDNRQVLRIWRDEELQEVERTNDSQDTYDPRQRPWYTQASTVAGVVWTDPYIFFTSRQPGLTAAQAVLSNNGELVGVVGADVELSSLSSFLAQQPVTEFGAAVIAHRNGEVLAYPFPERLYKTTPEGQLRLAKLDELDIITAKAAGSLRESSELESMRVTGFSHNGEDFISMFVPFFEERDWIMGVYAPERHFAGSIREGQRLSVIWAVAISVAITAMAFFAGLPLLIHFVQNRTASAANNNPPNSD